jgi:hypothetical protein
MAGRQGLRVANAVMLAVFAASAVVQWNDPDPVQWMLIYGAAAAACAWALRRALPWPAPAAVGAVALAWALTLVPEVLAVPGVLGDPALWQVFSPRAMLSSAVEEARERLGLLLVAAWMAVLVAARRVPVRTDPV